MEEKPLKENTDGSELRYDFSKTVLPQPVYVKAEY